MSAQIGKSIIQQIRAKILMSGPIPVSEYMKMSLTSSFLFDEQITKKSHKGNISNSIIRETHPGYYMNKDVFGSGGDFITSPEISQCFGEMIGVWGLETWMRIGGPKKFNIVEFGPGRGTMLKDILRVFKKFDNLTGKDVNVHLVEISPYLATVQYNNLCRPTSEDGKLDLNFEDSELLNPLKDNEEKPFYHEGTSIDSGYPIFWYRDIQSLPREFSLYVAHEFFDALPIHKLQKSGAEESWKEILIDIHPEKEDHFRFVQSRNETPAIKLIKHYYDQILRDKRSHLEFSLEGARILEELTDRIEEKGGLVLLADYGHDGTKEDTFRGFSQHSLIDPLIQPGSADLTADVDFSIIKKLFHEKAWICGPISQRSFLQNVGINLRLQKLLESCESEESRKVLESGHKMLMEEMGERFKFICLFPKVLEECSSWLKIPGFYSTTTATTTTT